MTTEHRTECAVIRDLLPLYIEGLVSEETEVYIETHLADCPACRAEYDALEAPPPTQAELPADPIPAEDVAPLKTIKRRLDLRLHSVAYLALIFFALFGFSLSAGADVMFNSLIMPVVGIFGYLAFRWRAVYKVPVLLVVVDAVVVLMRLTEAHPLDMVAFTLLYILFALAGVTIAHLLHIVFRRDLT